MFLAKANDTFLQPGTAGAREYYTDGSVDPNTDSMTLLQSLRRTPVRDNVRLITMIRLLLSRLKDKGKRVTLAWIPSIDGNEIADNEARRALTQDQLSINVPLSFQQIKKLARSATTQRTREQRRDAEAHSATLQWQVLATNGEPLVLPNSITRSLGENFQGEHCRHCGDFSEEPLIHYLLDCEATVPLRALAVRHGHAESRDRWTSAARLVRFATDDYQKLLDHTQRGQTICVRRPSKGSTQLQWCDWSWDLINCCLPRKRQRQTTSRHLTSTLVGMTL
ncbi:hypothetical protein E2C01_058107 [Portunus trituberculatus]|uniref:RNase H type-1 domain-containing protein n=1 Tax=Portunus trituberculatus TaxID=210409 RepID=A0A5B7H4E6_PORTR|nr:hypothetical protein [Portunus trituberculatus]